MLLSGFGIHGYKSLNKDAGGNAVYRLKAAPSKMDKIVPKF
jgi:hypothetical protein